MKLGTLAASILLGGTSLLVACSGSSATFDDTDAGGSSSGTTGTLPGSSSGSSGSSSGTSGSSSGTSGSSGDGGSDGGTSSSGGTIIDTKLRAGETFLVGVTTGATPHAVYYLTNAGGGADLEAVPLAGGAAVVLQANLPDDDFAFVRGGAVAWFTGTEAGTSGKGKATAINIWTKVTGTKTVTTPTRSDLFAASEDGTLVAFGTASSDTKTDLVVTTSAAPNTTAQFTGANSFNWAAAMGTTPTCTPRIGFAGTVFIATYCTGTAAAAVAARLGTVAAAGPTVTLRIDNATAANAIQPFFSADAAGDKIFVLGPKPANQGRVVVAGASTTVGTLDSNIARVVVAKDGSFVAYQTGAALKKATFAATPVVTTAVASGVLDVLGATADTKYVVYSTAVDADDDTLSDAKLVDVTAAAPAPVTLLATATAKYFAVTASAVEFTDEIDADTGMGKVKSVPFAGGAPKVLDPAAFFAIPSDTGDGVLVLEDTGTDGDTWTVQFVNAALGGTLLPVSMNMADQDGWQWSGKTFVYSDIGTVAPGVHAAKTP